MQIARGGMVMAATTVASRAVGAAALVMLARLLEPRDFGLVALAMVLFSTTNLFSDLGMRPALIHSKKDKSEVAFPAFVITVLAGLTLFLIVNGGLPYFASLLGNPEVTPVIRWLSVLILLNALSMVPTALLRKDLMFGEVSKSILVSEVLNNVSAISLALLGFGLWSLVYAKLIGSVARLVVVWVTCPGWYWLIPRKWDWGTIRELFRYGIQSTASGFMSFFNSNWDDWLVGRVLGVASLGFYNRAYSLTNRTIAGFNRRVVNAVLFPSYARIQDEKERLARMYIKGLAMVALILAPVALGILIIAGQLIPIALGEKWVPMVPTLQIFAVMALVRSFAGSTSPLFRAVGRPDLNLRAGLVITIVMAPLVLLLLERGIAGVGFAVTAAYMVGFIYTIFQVHKVLPQTASKMVPAILPAIFAGFVMMLGVHLSKAPLLQLVGGSHDSVSLGAMILIGATIYVLTALVVRRALIVESIQLIASASRGRRRVALDTR